MSNSEDTSAIMDDEITAIGISFGNSYSSIAYTSAEGKSIVIANEEGDRQIPSVLSYIEGEEYHGTQAKSQLIRNPRSTVAYFRDFLGQSFESIDPTACHASAHPQKKDTSVEFPIKDSAGETRSTVSVSEITSRHLERLVKSATDYIGKKITAAVITVPTSFTDVQKDALRSSAKEAGLQVLQCIAEPVSALLAYDARPETQTADKITIVADIGGTRSDVAIIASRGGMYTILATEHDYSLGGAQLDQVLIDHFAKEFIKKHKTDPRENERSLAKLKLEAENTKKALSVGTTAALSIESLADGKDFSSTINRTRYELLSGKIFGQFSRLIQSALEKADLDVLDINEIILSGGTSHTPRIASNLTSLFPPSTIIHSPSTSPTALNPAYLSALGAATQASLISHFSLPEIESSTHAAITATPHLSSAVGVLMVSEDPTRGVFKLLLEPETAVPVRRSGVFAVPNREGVDVVVKVVEARRRIDVKAREKKVRRKGRGVNGKLTPRSSDEEEVEGNTSSGKAPVDGNVDGQSKTNGGADADDLSEETSSSDDDDDDDEDDSPQEIRSKAWTVNPNALAEMALRGIKKGGKVEVTVNITGEMGVSMTAREVGAQGGVRGSLEKMSLENGNA